MIFFFFFCENNLHNGTKHLCLKEYIYQRLISWQHKYGSKLGTLPAPNNFWYKYWKGIFNWPPYLSKQNLTPLTWYKIVWLVFDLILVLKTPGTNKSNPSFLEKFNRWVKDEDGGVSHSIAFFLYNHNKKTTIWKWTTILVRSSSWCSFFFL